MRHTAFVLAALGLLAVGAVPAQADGPFSISPAVILPNSAPAQAAVMPVQGLIYYGGPVWSRDSAPAPFPWGPPDSTPSPYYTYHPYYPGYYTSGYYSNYHFNNPEWRRVSPYRFYSLGPRAASPGF